MIKRSATCTGILSIAQSLFSGIYRGGCLIPEVRHLVWKEEVSELLEPITIELGIKLRLVDELPAMEEVQEFMQDFV